MKKSPIILGLLLVVMSCSKVPERDPSTVFRYNEPSGISTLDPAFAREQSNIWACHQLFNGLVQMDDNLLVSPAIASDWALLNDGVTYQFQLRNDVLFHKHESLTESERKVTGDDVVYSLNRLVDPKTASPGAWVLGKVDTLYSAHPDSVTIVLKEPFAPFLGLLTMKYCSVVPKEVVEALGPEFGRRPVGTGPFQFQWWSTDEKLVFRRNPDYHEIEDGEPLPYLEAVAVDFISDRQAAFMEFLKGETDFLSGLDASYKDELLTRDGALRREYQDQFDLQLVPYLNTEYLAINQQLPVSHPLSDERIRLALNLSIDRNRMMRFLRNGIGEPANGGMIPKGLPSFNPERTGGYQANRDSALALLAEAGYPNGNGMTAFTLSTTANYRDICEYLQASWNQLGIPVDVEVLPPATLREGKANGTLPFFRASWVADYPDAENYMLLFHSENHSPEGPNYTFFTNKQFDKLYDVSQRTLNAEDRIRLNQQLDSTIVHQAPVIPLYYDEVVRFVPKNIEGLTPNALNLLDLKRVKKR